MDLRELAKACASLSREEYVAARPHPLLVQLNLAPKNVEPKPRGPAFATMASDRQTPGFSKRDGYFAFPVEKREGANAFGFLVTLGRTKNNDIVLEQPSVSKFHASFKKDPNGRWTITDMSSTGIKLDGKRIAREEAVPLRSGHLILLADAIEMLFLLPSEAFDHLKRVGV